MRWGRKDESEVLTVCSEAREMRMENGGVEVLCGSKAPERT